MLLRVFLVRVLLVGSLLLVASASCTAQVKADVNWRSAQSPVKNQGHRGTCAAFAICGALETFPGVPGDLSEQLLYATLKLHQNAVAQWMKAAGHESELSEGDLLSEYIPLFEFLGTCSEAYLPYDPDPKRAAPSVPDEIARYLELAHVSPLQLERIRDGFGKYGFADDACKVFGKDAARDPELLKRLLDAGTLAIPIGYSVHVPSWLRINELGKQGPDGGRYVHPGMMHRFARPGREPLSYTDAKLESMKSGEDFVATVLAGGWQRRLLGDPKEYGGHAVLIVGYDERGFLAKNSWGTNWGDDGYFRINFDYHRLYAVQAMVIERARIRMPNLNPFEATRRIREGHFRVKVQRIGARADERLVLSTWMHEPRDAMYAKVHYRLEGRSGDGAWHEVVARWVDAGDEQSREGAPFVIAGDALTAAKGCNELRLEIRVAKDWLQSADGSGQPSYARKIAFTSFAPGIAGAVDLLPR